MAAFLPNIGDKGLWLLKAPFNNVLTPKVSYEVISIRRIADLLNSGEDPKEKYYALVAADQRDDVYTNDLANGVCIVTLQSDRGDPFMIPSSYIDGSPLSGGIPYHNWAVVVMLGPLPDTYDFVNVQNVVKSALLENTGIQAQTGLVVQSSGQLIDPQDDADMAQARNARIQDKTTDHAKLVEAQAENASLRGTIAQLEAAIKLLQPPTTP